VMFFYRGRISERPGCRLPGCHSEEGIKPCPLLQPALVESPVAAGCFATAAVACAMEPAEKTIGHRQQPEDMTAGGPGSHGRTNECIPLCVVCELEGRTTLTDVPHHLDPVANGGELYPGEEGLLPVCNRVPPKG